MKRLLITVGVFSIILASCGIEASNNTENSELGTKEQIIETAGNEHERNCAANGAKLNIDLRSYSENVRVLTGDDIYIKGVDCGYISELEPFMLVIEDQNQLDHAFERYSLGKQCSNNISSPFNDMVEKYPVRDYTYVIEYEETSCGLYKQQVGALVFDEKYLSFISTVDSVTPDLDISQPDVMGGYCFMAAVPKGALLNDRYERWTYLEENDMYQDNDFCYSVDYAAYETTELYDRYTDTEYDAQYIIRSEGEFREFISRSEDMKDSSGNPVFAFDPEVNYDNALLVCEFFKCEYEQAQTFSRGKVYIEDDYINMDYEKTDGSRTGFAYAIIPWEYIPETLSSYWEILEEEATTERPASDIEKYIDIDTDYIEEGYVAVFHGGVGEHTYETYVYKDNEGFSYVNFESTTISWGTPIWEHKKKSRGSGKTRDEIIKIAEKHGADSFVTFPDDSNPHSINEFMDMDFE